MPRTSKPESQRPPSQQTLKERLERLDRVLDSTAQALGVGWDPQLGLVRDELQTAAEKAGHLEMEASRLRSENEQLKRERFFYDGHEA